MIHGWEILKSESVVFTAWTRYHKALDSLAYLCMWMKDHFCFWFSRSALFCDFFLILFCLGKDTIYYRYGVAFYIVNYCPSSFPLYLFVTWPENEIYDESCGAPYRMNGSTSAHILKDSMNVIHEMLNWVNRSFYIVETVTERLDERGTM